MKVRILVLVGAMAAFGCEADPGGVDSGSDTGGGGDTGMDGGTDSGMDGGTDSGMDGGDPCDDAACDTNATCDSSTGAAVCECNAGFSGDGMTCTEDPSLFCTMDVCGVGECVEEDDDYSCTCPDGYMDDGTTCADVDECADDTICGLGTCTNEDGGYSCTCPEGTEDDGTTCVDIDECDAGTDTCADEATCTNTDGSFMCTCGDGYTGDGETCTDVDECAMDLDDCGTNFSCINEPGTFSCECLEGFTAADDMCVRGSVLLYVNQGPLESIETALSDAGYVVTAVDTAAPFRTAFDGGEFDVVIVDVASTNLVTEDVTRLTTRIAAEGRTIVAAYDLDDLPALATAVGVSAVTYSTARNVVSSTGTLIDLFDQFDAIDAPIPATDMWADDGDELTLTGEGLILASLGTADGAGAIALTNDGTTLVHGFVAGNFLTADGDADDVLDMAELYRNEVNLLMNPVVLTYNRGNHTSSEDATKRLLWTAMEAQDDDARFALMYDTDLADIVVIDIPGGRPGTEVTSRLTTGIPDGDRVLFAYWDLNGDEALQTLLRVDATNISDPPELFSAEGSSISLFESVQSVPQPLTPTDDRPSNGASLTVMPDDGFIAIASGSAMGVGVAAVTYDGAVIVNGFMPEDYRSANTDGDMRLDIEELYENEFFQVLE